MKATRFARIVGAAEHLETELQQAILETDDQTEKDNLQRVQLQILRGIYARKDRTLPRPAVAGVLSASVTQ